MRRVAMEDLLKTFINENCRRMSSLESEKMRLESENRNAEKFLKDIGRGVVSEGLRKMLSRLGFPLRNVDTTPLPRRKRVIYDGLKTPFVPSGWEPD